MKTLPHLIPPLSGGEDSNPVYKAEIFSKSPQEIQSISPVSAAIGIPREALSAAITSKESLYSLIYLFFSTFNFSGLFNSILSYLIVRYKRTQLLIYG